MALASGQVVVGWRAKEAAKGSYTEVTSAWGSGSAGEKGREGLGTQWPLANGDSWGGGTLTGLALASFRWMELSDRGTWEWQEAMLSPSCESSPVSTSGDSPVRAECPFRGLNWRWDSPPYCGEGIHNPGVLSLWNYFKISFSWRLPLTGWAEFFCSRPNHPAPHPVPQNVAAFGERVTAAVVSVLEWDGPDPASLA